MKSAAFIVLSGLLSGASQVYGAPDASLQLELEYRGFYELDPGAAKFDSSYSGSIQPELEGSFNDGNTYYEFIPFARWDSEDSARDHGDIRELNLVHVAGSWETLFGISKVSSTKKDVTGFGSYAAR